MKKLQLFCIILILLFTTLIHAAATGKLAGTITDENGKPVPFANILLTQNGVGITGGQSNVKGAFYLINIRPGTYNIKVAQVSFHPKETKGIVIEANKILEKSFILKESIDRLKGIVISDEQHRIFNGPKNGSDNIFDLDELEGCRAHFIDDEITLKKNPNQNNKTNLGVLTGKVWNPDSTAVPYANIVLIQNETGISGGIADKKGNYTITNIPPGTYDIMYTATANHPKILEDVIIKVGEVTTQSVILNTVPVQINPYNPKQNKAKSKTANPTPVRPTGKLIGRLTNEYGEIITRAVFRLFDDDKFISSAHLFGDGNYIIKNIPTGIFNLKILSASNEHISISNIKLKDGETTSLDIVLKLVTDLHGNIKDSNKTAIINASVSLLLDGETISSTMTNKHGSFAFPRILIDKYDLKISADNFRPTLVKDLKINTTDNKNIIVILKKTDDQNPEIDIHLAPEPSYNPYNRAITIGEIKPKPVLKIPTKGKLEGAITNEIGKTVPFANIVLVENKIGITGGQSNEKGSFSIQNIPPGTFDLRVTAIGHHPFTLKDVRINISETTTQNVTLERSVIPIKALPTYEGTVKTVEQHEMVKETEIGTEPTISLDKLDGCSVEQAEKSNITLPDSVSTNPLTDEILGISKLAGRITDSTENIVPFANITILKNGEEIAKTQANDEGTFAMIDIPPGICNIRISHPSYRPLLITSLRIKKGVTTIQNAVLSNSIINTSYTGKLWGTIMNDTGGIVSSATIDLVQDSVRVTGRYSGNGGNFFIKYIPPGTYDMKITKSSYHPLTVPGIVIDEKGRSEQYPMLTKLTNEEERALARKRFEGKVGKNYKPAATTMSLDSLVSYNKQVSTSSLSYSVHEEKTLPFVPIESAKVILIKDGKEFASAFTDERGYSRFTNILPGKYNIVVSAEGYVTNRRTYTADEGNYACSSGTRLYEVGRVYKLHQCEVINTPYYYELPYDKEICGTIEGYVKDEDGNPISGARFTTTNRDYLAIYTDKNGYFKIEDIPSNLYKLSVSADSYETQVLEKIKIKPNKTKSLKFTLKKSR